MPIPADFSFTSNALNYKYEIYNQSAHRSGSKSSGLLVGDYGGTTKWDGDPGEGGATQYTIKYYVDLATAADGADINLETIDVTFDFNTDIGGSSLFNNFSGSTFTAGSSFKYAVSNSFLAGDGIRFTGAVGDKLASGGSEVKSSSSWVELFSLSNVSLNGSEAMEALTSDVDGAGIGSELGFIDMTANTNIYDTVLSERVGSDSKIMSLSDAGRASETLVKADDKFNRVSIHEAKSQLEDFGTTIYTQRYIGSSDKTFLVRAGDTVSADSYWTNAGTYSESLTDLVLSNVGTSDLTLDLSRGTNFDDYDTGGDLGGETSVLEGLDVEDSSLTGANFTTTTAENVKLSLDVKVSSTATVGEAVSGLDFFKVTGKNNDSSNGTVDSSKVTANVVTFAGDVNYDGRVSLKDLAFLNAGKIAQAAGAQFSDVDANYDNSITVSDLAVLSSDWGKTIHGTGAGKVETTDLTTGFTSWSNITASSVNSSAGAGTLDPFADINNAVEFSNSAFDAQAAVESSHSPLVIGTGLSGDSLTL